MRSRSIVIVLMGLAAISLALFALNGSFTKRNVTMRTTMTVTSSAFLEGTAIPTRYTCDAAGISPPLSIGNVPAGAVSFVLIMFDPDVPTALKPDGRFLHWLVFNIPADTRELDSNAEIGISGMNDSGDEGYAAPCPPKNFEPHEHRYIFHFYALNTSLSLNSGASERDVRQAMQGHVIGEAELMGRYARK